MILKHCSACKFNTRPKIPVDPQNQYPVVVVGDSPTATDTRAGILHSNKNLDIVHETLKKLPFKLQDVKYTTALKCSIPKKKGLVIPKTTIHTCRPYLIEELQMYEPKIVILLGTTALKVALGDNAAKFRDYRGLAFNVSELPNTHFFSVIHPAQILRAPGEYKSFYNTIAYAYEVLNSGVTRSGGTTEYTVCRTEEDVREAYEFLKDYPQLACDIETTQLSPFYSKNQRVKGESLVIGIAYDKNKTIGFAKSAIPYMQQIFDLPNEFIWHGGKFDKLFEKVADGLDIRIDHDLMLADYTLNETSGTHDLEQISMRLLGVDAYKDEANKYIRSAEGFASAPEEVQLKRVCMDADYTRQCFLLTYPHVLANKDYSTLYHERLIPGANAYTSVERNGLKLDKQALAKAETEYTIKIDKAIEETRNLISHFWDPQLYAEDVGSKSIPKVFNPGSTKQVAWVLYDVLQLKPGIKKRGKARSTAAEILESIPKPRHPFVDKLLDLRKIKKEYDTYVKGFIQRMDEDDKVHSNFSLHITVTGRRSSQNPNVQNIPSRRRDIRRLFVPEDGYVLADIDYSAAESRVLALVSNDDNYLQVFLEDRDPHGELAAKLYGANYTKIDRDRAKAVNFGVPYGRGAKSVAEQNDMPLSDAEALIEEWANMYPEAWSYLQNCANMVLKGESIRSPLGRYKRPGLIAPENIAAIQNEYKNFTIQSTVADFILLAVIELDKILDPNECTIVNEVHDSLLFQIKDNEEIIRRNTKIIVDVMESIPRRYLKWTLPFHCDVELGYNWADICDIEKFFKLKQKGLI